MDESLTERRRVDDEGRKVVKSFWKRGIREVRETPHGDGSF